MNNNAIVEIPEDILMERKRKRLLALAAKIRIPKADYLSLAYDGQVHKNLARLTKWSFHGTIYVDTNDEVGHSGRNGVQYQRGRINASLEKVIEAALKDGLSFEDFKEVRYAPSITFWMEPWSDAQDEARAFGLID